MLVPSARSLLAKPAFYARPLSQQAALPTTATQQLLLPRVKPVQHPYFLDRNSRGSLPVYTEIRAQGAKHTVLIRNVEGNIRALADDLASSLFPPASPEAERLKIQIVRSKHLVLSGGRWKMDVMDWLKRKGF
ncbi:uncharacterized protein STEHIDRAFT_52267 [Stereum hirsutum FP-91666 SS1]|uniref:uncharacterized protein n=1 Tax=Stereum hirsutum (strain FP-91666) TaxID=721885 RepID=UPI000440B7AD|nr:uncharacterized protein STEHIDRAFT_52267 [Stereum hirsutum FP-91666 SS1]EIM90221.1 hypothetical protein STEHIDRAFT_52267 [Stereum hirsutum FP-91666 SS1]